VGPLLAADEMGQPDRQAVVERLSGIEKYPALFAEAFPGRGLSPATLAEALAVYQASLIAGGSAFDRSHSSGEGDRLSAEEQWGWTVFTGKGGCVSCHRVEQSAALFTDHLFHNTGVGWRRTGERAKDVQLAVAPGQTIALSVALIENLFGTAPADEGRFEVTGREQDRRAFRTPSLRNVALTAPYMHDGSLSSLEAVVDYYNRGGAGDLHQDPRIRPLGLSIQEKRALVAFLRSLTSPEAARLASEARAAAVDSGAR
jgi:cytochrome c peroxidase